MLDKIERIVRELLLLSQIERTRILEIVEHKQTTPIHTDAQNQVLNNVNYGWDLLTFREKQVLFLIVEGLINKQIAERLGISRRTVELHRLRCTHKLGAKNTADLCRIVSAMRILDAT